VVDGSEQNPTAKKPRGPGKRFEKGKSGNPGGRPKEVGHVKELAKQHTELAIKTLAEICEHGDKSAARVAAAEALLNHAWGRPEQAVSFEDKDGKAIVPHIEIVLHNDTTKV